MEGKQLSTSRAVAIYVRDVLERYDPDPVRYFLTAAGPETQDTDFTWAEFLRRNNDELLANWGNLVNRTLTNAHRNFGEVPAAGELTDTDRETLAAIEGGFESVGKLIEEARFKAALAEAMRLSSIGNQYVDHEAPWAVIKDDRARAGTILHVALRVVDSLKVIFTPFLPFTSQRLHELLGYEGRLAGPLEFREIEEQGGERHTILTGDYASWVGRWQPSELPTGQKFSEPEPLFRKLDPSIVDEELTRLTTA
jgi:methionyl-tRNA synthetase